MHLIKCVKQSNGRLEEEGMNADKLRTILEKHEAWLSGEEGGERANFRGSDFRYDNFRGSNFRCADFRDASFRYANFRGSDFRGSNFRGCDLRYADFRSADLRYADFRGCDLRNADFRGCDLRYAEARGSNFRGAIGLLLLPVQDPRGYSFPHAVLCEHGWRIRAGCRDFLISEARAHWGDAYEGDREIADMYLHAINWLEAKVATMDEKV